MPDSTTHIAEKPLRDPFGRRITYLRLSVTDRCDLRCSYCMAEHMTFLPKPDVLTLEELLALSEAFMERGVRRIRLTGGEPLVRKNILWLIRALGDHVKRGTLDEVTLTTNGTQLGAMADDLYAAGVRRINVSLDTLSTDLFSQITRRDRLEQVLEGIQAAKSAGLKVKVNTVALKGINADELTDITAWCVAEGLDHTLIETMPLGEVEDAREDHYLPLTTIFPAYAERWQLSPSPHRTGGPARYFDIKGTENRLGFITPLTGNFCDGCNRVRVTCTGRIYMCLGQDDHVDLRAALRSDTPHTTLMNALDRAIGQKPKGHDFAMEDGRMVGSLGRHMSQTGG
ncbi:GTP 3',8-cyclase MoaA [Kordiimonas marina]|uniref:GTP 3',8-cyclase MoaA n=1 Tax=Kordiimonas marina TaxID=2872312 RepID=UPI001FF2EF23|nr:GTP 3',8-cyclase MoaA [Kordiimonas marina]MCJ9430179.1 GTP 3',8-cyclase MoaA [Kordiimonas marina]